MLELTGTTSRMSGFPVVKVPVLSKTTASTSARLSRGRPPLIKIPFRIAFVMADRTVVGAAIRIPVP